MTTIQIYDHRIHHADEALAHLRNYLNDHGRTDEISSINPLGVISADPNHCEWAFLIGETRYVINESGLMDDPTIPDEELTDNADYGDNSVPSG